LATFSVPLAPFLMFGEQPSGALFGLALLVVALAGAGMVYSPAARPLITSAVVGAGLLWLPLMVLNWLPPIAAEGRMVIALAIGATLGTVPVLIWHYLQPKPAPPKDPPTPDPREAKWATQGELKQRGIVDEQ
jgi:hypothetical protein